MLPLDRILGDYGGIPIPPIVRMKAVSTYHDLDLILDIVRNLTINRIVVGMRDDRWNELALVMAFQGKSKTLLFDTTTMNIARLPRQKEFRDMLNVLAKADLIGKVRCCPRRLPETSHLPPSIVVQQLFAIDDTLALPSPDSIFEYYYGLMLS